MTPFAFRLALLLAVSILMGIAVLYARPAGHKHKSSASWRGHVKPPPPPP